MVCLSLLGEKLLFVCFYKSWGQNIRFIDTYNLALVETNSAKLCCLIWKNACYGWLPYYLNITYLSRASFLHSIIIWEERGLTI
uniref:SFRICE_036445 n=1 Tax=Spodoptera frugiperda TaxID=7108 RepID=A0A2H1VBR0_SPOFR